MSFWVVRTNVVGYMPEGDNGYFANLKDAEQYALSLVREYREEDYVVHGSLRERFYTCRPKIADDYTLNTVIVIDSIDKELFETEKEEW